MRTVRTVVRVVERIFLLTPRCVTFQVTRITQILARPILVTRRMRTSAQETVLTEITHRAILVEAGTPLKKAPHSRSRHPTHKIEAGTPLTKAWLTGLSVYMTFRRILASGARTAAAPTLRFVHLARHASRGRGRTSGRPALASG